jgi:hypothetical protein
MLSKMGSVSPFFRSLAISSAQRRLMTASHARQSIRSTTASNQRCSWLVRSRCWHRRGTSSEFRRRDILGRLSSIGRLEPAFDRTSEQELNQALIAPPFRSFQKILALIQALDVKFLAWLNAILLPDFDGQDNLSLAGYDRFHAGKIMSYYPDVKRVPRCRWPGR